MFLLLLTGCTQNPESHLTRRFKEAKKAIISKNMAELDGVVKTSPNVVHARDGFDKSTLLHIACVNVADEAIVEYLLRSGSDPNAKNDVGQTPLHVLCRFSGRLIVAEILVKHGAKSSIFDAYEKTAADYADTLEYQRVEMLALLKSGAVGLGVESPRAVKSP